MDLTNKYWFSQPVHTKIVLGVSTLVTISLFGLKYFAQQSQNTNIFKDVQLTKWAKMGKYFNWNGYAIFYIEFVNKNVKNDNVLLMVHGFPTSSYDFHQVIEKLILCNKFSKIIAFDQMGHGFSDKPNNDIFYYSVHKQVDILQALIKYHNLKKFKIMAHDLGDTVIQEYLARIIDDNVDEIEIESICFLNGGIFPSLHRPILAQKLSINPITKPLVIQLFNKKSLARSTQKTWGKRIKLNDDILNKMWLVMTHKNGVAPLVNILRYLNERKQFEHRWINSISDFHSKLKIPILLINGLLDPISGKHMADKFESQFINATVVKLHDVGHWPIIEAPQDVVDNYIKFIS